MVPPSELGIIPGVGEKIADKLNRIGVFRVRDLAGGDPEALYHRLEEVEGCHIDRCVLYVFRAAVYFASRDTHDPELLKWWHWKDQVPH